MTHKQVGGIYISPEHVFKSLVNSARWADSLSCSVVFFFAWIRFWDFDCCDSRFEVLVFLGILGRPRLNIVGSVWRWPGPAASGRWSIDSWWLGLWPVQKKSIFSMPIPQNMQHTFSFCGAVFLLTANPWLRNQRYHRCLVKKVAQLLGLVWLFVEVLLRPIDRKSVV